MNILVRFDHYIDYLDKNNTNFLDRKNKYKIWTKSKSKVLNEFKSIKEEVFNGTSTEYTILKNKENYLISFKTKSGEEYRFDLIKEPGIETNIYHLAFTLSERSEEEYEEPTNLGESIEVFSKLIWILRDLKLNADEFCIGATGDRRKDAIYKYMMSGVKNWEKRSSDNYDLGWAIYFNI